MNASLVVTKLTKIKSGIMKHVHVNVKTDKFVKKIILEIVLLLTIR